MEVTTTRCTNAGPERPRPARPGPDRSEGGGRSVDRAVRSEAAAPGQLGGGPGGGRDRGRSRHSERPAHSQLRICPGIRLGPARAQPVHRGGRRRDLGDEQRRVVRAAYDRAGLVSGPLRAVAGRRLEPSAAGQSKPVTGPTRRCRPTHRTTARAPTSTLPTQRLRHRARASHRSTR